MIRPKKSWAEKLADDKGFSKVFEIDPAKSKRWGAGTFVIPAPREVDELMRRVPKGRITTIGSGSHPELFTRLSGFMLRLAAKFILHPFLASDV